MLLQEVSKKPAQLKAKNTAKVIYRTCLKQNRNGMETCPCTAVLTRQWGFDTISIIQQFGIAQD